MKDERPVPRLSKTDRWALSATAVSLAVARVIWPDLPIDATTIGLLGLGFVVLKWDIESFEFLGVRAKRAARELEEDSAKLKALPPPAKVETPPAPEVSEEPVSNGDHPTWYRRASQAATDLMPPDEPIARILWAAEQIRVELTILAGNSGHLPPGGSQWSAIDPRILASSLVDVGIVPKQVAEAVPRFMEIRNQAAHAELRDSELIAAAEGTGLELVQKLRGIPREWIRVLHSRLSIYADRAGTHQHSYGVMLIKLDDDGEELHRAVYPCTDAPRRGSFVTWEWDPARRSDQEAWYHDPETSEPELAWSRSMFFVGRPYPDEWGLIYRFPRPDVGLDDLEG